MAADLAYSYFVIFLNQVVGFALKGLTGESLGIPVVVVERGLRFDGERQQCLRACLFHCHPGLS